MGFSLGKVFKPIKKATQKAWNFVAPIGGAIAGGVLGGPAGAAVGLQLGSSFAGQPGESPERSAQKRADFEYARSLADQRAFQDDSIQRRIADARQAGIHPLAALGFQAPSFTPPMTSEYPTGGGNDLGEMGQDIGRAIYAAQTEKERRATATTQAQLDALILQRTGLENRNLEADLVNKQLRNMQLLQGKKPAFPDVNAIRNVGVQELGQGDIKPTYSFFRTPSGEVVRVQSADFGEASENDIFSMATGVFHNWLKPWSENETKLFQKHTVKPIKEWWERATGSPTRKGSNVRQYR